MSQNNSYTSKGTVKVSDLRKHTLKVIEEVERLEIPITVMAHSTPRITIINTEIFEALREQATQNNARGPITENINIFADPPDHLLIKKPGLDAVDIIRKERQ